MLQWWRINQAVTRSCCSPEVGRAGVQAQVVVDNQTHTKARNREGKKVGRRKAIMARQQWHCCTGMAPSGRRRNGTSGIKAEGRVAGWDNVPPTTRRRTARSNEAGKQCPGRTGNVKVNNVRKTAGHRTKAILVKGIKKGHNG